MGDLTKGKTFTTNEEVTNAKLHALVDDATINAGAITSTMLSSALLLDEDTMASNSATSVATQQSIVAYTVAKRQSSLTYYVRADGSDSNTGLVNDASGAFLTIQKAVDVATKWQRDGYDITIQVGAGTYTGAVIVDGTGALGASQSGDAGDLIIVGDTSTPSNVVISTTSSNAFTVTGPGTQVVIRGFRIATTTSGSCIVADRGAVVELGSIEFHTCAGSHIIADHGGMVFAFSSDTYEITGAAADYHYRALNHGHIELAGLTIDCNSVSGAFDTFAICLRLGSMLVNGNTYSNSASITGVYYSATQNSVIDTNGGGGTYFPGNSAGSTATGGVYA